MLLSSKKAQEYYKKFEETHDIIHWFASLSAYVWDEMEFARQDPEVKIDERKFTIDIVTQTMNLIKRDEIPLPIRLFHAHNERENGNDIEIILQLEKDKNVIFPCQAKRLYVENARKDNLKAKYEKLNYKSQKNDLISYAEKIKGFPLYLLYNYSEYKFSTNYVFPDKELYGCTLASALYLNQNPPQSPIVADLHPPAKPLTSIVKFKNILSLNSLWGSIEKHSAILHTDKAIFGDNKWEEYCPPSSHKTRYVSSKRLEDVLSKSVINIERPFNPKYRIVLTVEKIPLFSRKK
jgi:hypothetical protein